MNLAEEKPKKKRGRPTAKKQIDKEIILDIAIKVFGNQGFDGTRLGDIAEQAGISNASMTYHFESKDNLWTLAVLQLGEKLKKRFEDANLYLKDLEGAAALKAYTRQLVYFSAEHPEFYKVVFHEMCTETARAHWLIKNILTPIHKLFDDQNAEMKEGKLVFQGVPVANLTSIILGATNAFFIHAIQMKKMYDIDPLTPEEIESHANWVIDIVLSRFK